MSEILIIAILSGLGAMLGWGLSDFFAKKSVDKIGPLTSLLWMQLWGIIPLIFIFFQNYSITNIPKINIPTVMLLALADSIGYYMFYKALEKGKVSIIGPIVASYAAFSVIFAMLFFKETISSGALVSFAIIILGIIITSIDYDELKKEKLKLKDIKNGIPEAIIAVLIISAIFPLWGRFTSNYDWIVSLLYLRIFMSLSLFIFALINKEKIIVKDFKINRWLVLIGLFDVIAYITLSWGYSNSNLHSIITVLSSTFSIPTLILARIFLKEKIKGLQLLGIITILIGIIILSF